MDFQKICYQSLPQNMGVFQEKNESVLSFASLILNFCLQNPQPPMQLWDQTFQGLSPAEQYLHLQKISLIRINE